MGTPRTTMSQIITRVSLLIGDPTNATWAQGDIQDFLDETRDDVRYELLTAAPTIINSTGTLNVPNTLWADYYSMFQWWEQDVVLEGTTGTPSVPWIVLTPLSSDYITGHWMFDTLTPFTTGTVPGQYPPVFATGKVYDINRACANICDAWAAQLMRSYNFTSDGQTFDRSQMLQMTLQQAKAFRMKAKPLTGRAIRDDYPTPGYSRSTPLLGDINGEWSK